MKVKRDKFIVRVWKKLKKPLNIFSYICTVLFWIILFVSCGSTSKVQSVKAETSLSDLKNTYWNLNEDFEYYPDGRPFNVYDTDQLSYDLDFYTSGDDQYYNTLLFNEDTLSFNDYIVYQKYIDPNLNNWIHGEWFRFIVILGGNDSTNTLLIDWLFQNATLLSSESVSFTFNYGFNYNAPYSASYDSVFVSVAESGVLEKITYNFDSPFVSNGQLFTEINLYYIQGNGTAYFENPQGTLVKINNNSNLYYFSYMTYDNVRDDTSIMVAQRRFRSYYNSSSDTTNMALDFGSDWVNSEYQYIDFIAPLSVSQLNWLSQFNTNQYINGISTGVNNIGLSNVFVLLSTSFSSLLPILRIEILPSITIGLLVFMPLIVGIITFIIWLVKR